MQCEFKCKIDFKNEDMSVISCGSPVIRITISIDNYEQLRGYFYYDNYDEQAKLEKVCAVCIRAINFSFLNLYDRRSGNIALCFDLEATLTSPVAN